MTTEIQRVAVLGAGSWGTTFAKVLADAGRDVVLWARRPDVAAAITERRCNPEYLPGVELPPLEATTTRARPRSTAPTPSCSPSRRRRCGTTSRPGGRCSRPGRTLVSLAKGVELGTLVRMSEVIAEVAEVPPITSRCSRARTSPARSPRASRPPR